MKILSTSLFLGFLTSAIHCEVVTLVHPEEKLPVNRTVIWSPLFQATWDKLNATLGGLPTRIEPPNALMTQLDAFKWNADQVMPEGSWKTWCGPATRGFLKQVNAEAAAMSHTPEGPFKLTMEDPRNRASFGLLDHDVDFMKSFARCVRVPMNFHADGKEQPVQFFGSADFVESVLVLACRPVDGSFALQINCKQSDDKVILYRPTRKQDFATACHWLRTWRSQFKVDPERRGAWDDRLLHSEDEIQIPYVDLNARADLTDRLGGLRYYPNNPPWFIVHAEQLTRFQLHEKGARVRVETSIEAGFGPSPPKATPRKFIFDRPFYVFLWREKAEWPFFGAWVGDASALKPFR